MPIEAATHFLMKLMFCMFAEDIDLLSEKVFTRILSRLQQQPKILADRLGELFKIMVTGGAFCADNILFFNGGLFADAEVVEMTPDEIKELVRVNECDWGSVEPSIFGTLLERSINPDKRSQVGTHYTGKDDILTLIEPVVMAPLRQEWEAVKARCEELWAEVRRGVRANPVKTRKRDSKARRAFDELLLKYVEDLSQVTVLDPACGSGNFLYVAINLLLELEKEVITYAANHSATLTPRVNPTQLAGMEVNPYAQQLAQVVIWIGHLQWRYQNGFAPPINPVLSPTTSIRLMDAILDTSDPAKPKEPEWPEAKFIVGNPPFLGGNKVRDQLTDSYVEALFMLYRGRVPAFSDLCCYWFEKARHSIEIGKSDRAGLLATQGIRGGVNREVLKRIKQTGDIFFAMSDRPWVLEGVSVHVSLIGFDGGKEKTRTLNGLPVDKINPDLTSDVDVTQAKPLPDNLDLWCYGSQQKANFDIPFDLGLEMLLEANPDGDPNSDVVKPSLNGAQILRKTHESFVIDFGLEEDEKRAAKYEAPFEYVKRNIYPVRKHRREVRQSRFWWLHARPSPRYRLALRQLDRYIATPVVSKHRIFVWIEPAQLVDHATVVFLTSSDYIFGVLHSRIHEIWARQQATQVRERESGLRYTATTCFETFPFPCPTGGQQTVISEAAQELNRLRTNWLNPKEWIGEEVLEFPGSINSPWKRYVQNPDQHGVGTVRYPRLVPKNEECAKKLAIRTLTNLYNQRPTWLENAHRELDEAVFAAYGWKPTISNEEILRRLLKLNLELARKKASVLPGFVVQSDQPA